MATYFVSSVDGSDVDPGTDWASAKATLAAGLALCTANGDILKVDSAHAETSGSSITLNLGSSIYVTIISVNRSSSDAYLAGASVTLTANGTSHSIATSGGQHLRIFGVSFITSNGNSNSNTISLGTVVTAISTLECYDCTFSTLGSGVSATILAGALTSASVISPTVRLINCTFVLHNSTSSNPSIRIGQGNIQIINPTISFGGANKPTTCFGSSVNTAGHKFLLVGDVTGYNATGGTTFSVANFGGGTFVLRNVKYSSTPTFIGGTFASNTAEFFIINCDSGDTKTVYEYRTRLGTITAKTNKYADDGLTIKGTLVGWEVVTTSLCNPGEIFCTPEIIKASTSTSSMTATIEWAQESSATALKNSEAWFDVEYVSSSSFPLGTVVSSRQATPLATAVDCDTSTLAWTGLSGTPTKQKISHTFTPGEACDIRGRMCFGVASKTVYIDPTLRFS